MNKYYRMLVVTRNDCIDEKYGVKLAWKIGKNNN